ncbi:MAG TPA: hypothetical protein PLZ51_18615, partial [Aggregatilineales bacterium]|nr:hypothetical protein [Aggregatilineales bacterium]
WQGGRMDEITRHRFIREQIGLQVDDVISQTERNIAEYAIKTPMDVQNHNANIASHSDTFIELNKALKSFLYQNMYYHHTVIRMAKRAERFLTEIFNSYISEPRQLPDDYQSLLKEQPVHRVVTDYIAGLTDRSAQQEYRRLFDSLTSL